MMEDPELIALNKLKNELVAKAKNLIEKLKEQENQQEVVMLNLPRTTESGNNTKEKLQGQYTHILCNVSCGVSGITFKDTDKKWLHDNVYKYTTCLKTKALNLYVELTVKLEDEKEFEICDITCHFINIDKCYMLEIESWVQNMTRMKNFSLLTSAISQYSEENVVRKRILDKLNDGKYVSCKQCKEENGGILVYIHLTENVKQVYLILQWSVLFSEQYWKMEHHFVINPEKTDNICNQHFPLTAKFAQENQSLLQNFCKPNLTKENVIDLWDDLCSVIDMYEDNNQSEINDDME
ncbi:uncharacterized protein LOC126923321 [Bombus affinis]|uniref:uncharacterized protein LOC126923321 n=1 Tax=Bombus affinis TaxID=309941 RepID=UPI0021B75846|nr:uncharacterized protein LOC126923321 [Bombus affinis]XP_050592640.1 uncharacterized protein LOC126923321 [Bombus affinis]